MLAPVEERNYVVGTVDDMRLFTSYLLMLAHTAPFKIAPIRARIRRDLERARDGGTQTVRTELPAEEAHVLQVWVVTQRVMLAHAKRRHMSRTLQRITFDRV